MKTLQRSASIVAALLAGYTLHAALSPRTPNAPVNRSIQPQLCDEHDYKARVYSLDPLVIHLSGFVSPSEAGHLVDVA